LRAFLSGYVFFKAEDVPSTQNRVESMR